MPAFIFQANPAYYDILARFRSAAFAAEPTLAWPAPPRQGDVQPGDWAFVYVGGSKAPGIYAAGKVTRLLARTQLPNAVPVANRAGKGTAALRQTQGKRSSATAGSSRLLHPRAAITVVRYSTNGPLIDREGARLNGIPVGVHWRTVVPLTEEQCAWLVKQLGLEAKRKRR
jgi:hypothetical protein